MGGVELTKEESLKDINGTAISSSSVELDLSQKNNMNFLKIDSSQAITAKYIDVQILTGTAVSDEYVYEGYVDDGYTEDL